MILTCYSPFCGIGERKCTILLANIYPMSSRIFLISLSYPRNAHYIRSQCAL